jgi:hypothetical protein
MTMLSDIIPRLNAALPSVREWIEGYLDAHAHQARAVSNLGFTRLSTCFPHELLERAKVVSVERVTFPPVHQFGLPEFAGIQEMSFQGITFKDTFFVQQAITSESLHFHELIHVVQWDTLGVDNFLRAYGVGLFRFGYMESPLEKMAFSLQDTFERDVPPTGLMGIIEVRTNAIWDQVAPIFQG